MHRIYPLHSSLWTVFCCFCTFLCVLYHRFRVSHTHYLFLSAISIAFHPALVWIRTRKLRPSLVSGPLCNLGTAVWVRVGQLRGLGTLIVLWWRYNSVIALYQRRYALPTLPGPRLHCVFRTCHRSMSPPPPLLFTSFLSHANSTCLFLTLPWVDRRYHSRSPSEETLTYYRLYLFYSLQPILFLFCVSIDSWIKI